MFCQGNIVGIIVLLRPDIYFWVEDQIGRADVQATNHSNQSVSIRGNHPHRLQVIQTRKQSIGEEKSRIGRVDTVSGSHRTRKQCCLLASTGYQFALDLGQCIVNSLSIYQSSPNIKKTNHEFDTNLIVRQYNDSDDL